MMDVAKCYDTVLGSDMDCKLFFEGHPKYLSKRGKTKKRHDDYAMRAYEGFDMSLSDEDQKKSEDPPKSNSRVHVKLTTKGGPLEVLVGDCLTMQSGGGSMLFFHVEDVWYGQEDLFNRVYCGINSRPSRAWQTAYARGLITEHL
jgi:hypothetical protein